jgi:hypothetical protein
VIDHDNLFTTLPRYAPAMAVKNDPRTFARKITEGGYATDPAYADKLIKLIDSLNLTRFDVPQPNATTTPVVPQKLGPAQASTPTPSASPSPTPSSPPQTTGTKPANTTPATPASTPVASGAPPSTPPAVTAMPSAPVAPNGSPTVTPTPSPTATPPNNGASPSTQQPQQAPSLLHALLSRITSLQG